MSGNPCPTRLSQLVWDNRAWNVRKSVHFYIQSIKAEKGEFYTILHIDVFKLCFQAHFYFLDLKKIITNNLLINYYFRRVP